MQHDPAMMAQARALRDRPGTVFVGAPNGHAPALPRASCLLVQALPGERPASGTEVAANLAAAVLPLLRPGDEVFVSWSPDASLVLPGDDIPTTEDLEEMLDDS